MKHTDEDIEFAGRMLTQRKEVADEEVAEWLQEKVHVELLDEIASMRQKLSKQDSEEQVDEEFRRLQQRVRNQKNRRITLRWSVAASIILLIGLFAGEAVNDIRDMREGPVLTENTMHPGKSKAVLIMADGKKVPLEQGQDLNIQLNNQVQVITTEKGITYKGKRTGSMKEEYNTLATPIGGEYSLTLSDGTKVYLNADSELKYPVEFLQEKRIVDLKGEAYFEVQKDSAHPFIVRINGAEVTVLGTSFNINAYGDDGRMYTTLINGSIRFTSEKNGQNDVLIPGMQSVMNLETGNVTLIEVDVEPYIAWRNGRFEFHSMTLDLLMRQLQRWYDFEVFYQNQDLKNYEFRGVINRDMELNKVLSVISETTTVDFEVKGKIITIIKR